MNSPGYNQRLAAIYMRDYDLEAHIQECCDLYRAKRDVMLQSLDKYVKGKAVWTHPEGGFFIWLTLPESIPGDEFTRYLINHKKLITVCGSAYRPVSYTHLLQFAVVERNNQGQAVREFFF